MEMTKQIVSGTGVTVLIISIECLRSVCIVSSIFPLLLFWTGERVLTGKEKYSEMCANSLEFTGKEQVENVARSVGISCNIY